MNSVAASKLIGFGSSASTFQLRRPKRNIACAERAAESSSGAQASGTSVYFAPDPPASS